MVAITIMAIMGMALPIASAGFTNYIFKEDFNGSTLDNSTWVNQSNPFPYEMKDGRIIVHLDTDPINRYSATDPIKLPYNKIHGEFKFSLYTSRYQANSSSSTAFLGVIFTDNRTADPVPPLGYNKGVWAQILASNDIFAGGRYDYILRIGNTDVTKSESYSYRGENYGIEISMLFVFNATIQDNNTMLINEQLYKNGKLLVAHEDYIKTFDKSMVVFFSTTRLPNRTPVDGYVAIDSIEIGQYSPEQVTETKATAYEYFMTVAIIMLLISGISLFFYDKAQIFDVVGVVAFYMALGLIALFFLTYPYQIFGLPSWIFALLPVIPIALGIVKAEKFMMFE